MLDERGRLWLTSAVRPPVNPAFCKEGSGHPSAQLTPVAQAGRHLQMYDPKTKQLTHISTCFSTHHLMFAEGANNTLWTSGGGPVVGWLNTRLFDQTGDEEMSQGWTALILDTNGNGQRDEQDKRIMNGFEGFSPRGADIDRHGVAWIAMASGHLARFDRRKCKVLNGPTATGQHCPEGWSFFKEPVPQMKGAPQNGTAEGQPVGCAQSPVSTWILHEVAGRTH